MIKKIPYNSVNINSGQSIRNAVRKINNTNKKFLIVTSEDNKLLGTVTDGDIRRAILKGVDLDNLVIKCMNKKPIYATEKTKNFYSLLKKTKSRLNFVPQVNKENKLISVIVYDEKDLEKTALIMAGGFGKRLGGLTKNIPKPLLKIGNEPILETIIKKLEESNYKKIYVSTHYLHNKIKKFLETRKSFANIEILRENKPLGTAGSISSVKNSNFDNLTVLNGDILTEVDLNALNQFHLDKGFDLTITVAHYSFKIPFGVVNLNNKFTFKSLSEKPTEKQFVLSGIYCLSKRVCKIVKKNYLDMPELINYAKALDYKIGVFPIYEYWNDIGTYESLNFEKNRKIK